VAALKAAAKYSRTGIDAAFSRPLSLCPRPTETILLSQVPDLDYGWPP